MIDQQGELDPPLVAKILRHLRDALPDRDQLGTAALNLRIVVAQLRDVITAESSAKMSEPDDDHRAVCPEITQSSDVAIGIAELQIGHDLHCFHDPILEGQQSEHKEAKISTTFHRKGVVDIGRVS